MWNCVYEQRDCYRREAETRQDATSTRRITPSRSTVAAREGISGVFRGSLKARGLRLVARSAGGPTFWLKLISKRARRSRPPRALMSRFHDIINLNRLHLKPFTPTTTSLSWPILSLTSLTLMMRSSLIFLARSWSFITRSTTRLTSML